MPAVAHLFVDMKDFVRQTARLKEAAVADYLRREFYVPILRAAAQWQARISLNNLVGDAVSFSGDVVALFDIARRIRALFEAARVEAGVFVAYGAQPVVIRIDDPVFGPLKVAIAEKINESARGTGRTARAREQFEALRRGAKGEFPFAVFVDPEHGEIYNAGAAVSADALEAYLSARRDELQIVRRSIDTADPLVFSRSQFEVVLCSSAGKLLEGYVAQGLARFKGFGESVAVYEMLDASSPFLQSLGERNG